MGMHLAVIKLGVSTNGFEVMGISDRFNISMIKCRAMG
jgi:hypothetical protein